MKRLNITGHDNRGTATEPYGYIYFTRGNHAWRVGYTNTHGVFAVDRTPHDLRPGEVYLLRTYAEEHSLIPTP